MMNRARFVSSVNAVRGPVGRTYKPTLSEREQQEENYLVANSIACKFYGVKVGLSSKK